MDTHSRSIVEQMLERDAFSRWLGVRICRLEEGAVDLEMTVRDEMLNGFGRCHGGVLFAFADSSLAFSCNKTHEGDGTGIQAEAKHD